VDAYLHGSADTEDAVVRLLWRESLDGLEHGVGLLWDQIIGPMKMHNQFAFPSLWASIRSIRRHGASCVVNEPQESESLPQAELSVTRSIGVPIGDGHKPALEKRALDDELGERWLRHDGRRVWN
jgi:hypothetical protein